MRCSSLASSSRSSTNLARPPVVIQELGREGILPFSPFFASNKPFDTPLPGLFTQYAVSCAVLLMPPAGDAYLFLVNSKCPLVVYLDIDITADPLSRRTSVIVLQHPHQHSRRARPHPAVLLSLRILILLLSFSLPTPLLNPIIINTTDISLPPNRAVPMDRPSLAMESPIPRAENPPHRVLHLQHPAHRRPPRPACATGRRRARGRVQESAVLGEFMNGFLPNSEYGDDLLLVPRCRGAVDIARRGVVLVCMVEVAAEEIWL